MKYKIDLAVILVTGACGFADNKPRRRKIMGGETTLEWCMQTGFWYLGNKKEAVGPLKSSDY